MKTLLCVLGVLLAATLGLAACGDDDDDETTALTESEWVAQADAICESGDREIDQAAEETFGGGGGRPSDAEVEEFANDTVIPGIQSQIDDVDALTPPDEIAGEVDAFLAAAQAELDEIEADPTVLSSGEDPFADTTELAADLGLEQCARD